MACPCLGCRHLCGLGRIGQIATLILQGVGEVHPAGGIGLDLVPMLIDFVVVWVAIRINQFWPPML